MSKIMVCNRCVMDSTVPDIIFDNHGECNYCKIHDAMVEHYPQGDFGLNNWRKIVDTIKIKGQNSEFDCIIGVSGGTDSSYLLHIAYDYGLRPLAVNFDNGWHSDIAVSNIKKITSALNIPLYTYVVDYEEMKDILLSFMKAGLPWIDAPTDYAINGSIYKIAKKFKIKSVLIGSDFRSEGKQPLEWTYSDQKQIKYISKSFGKLKNPTYPFINLLGMALDLFMKNYSIIFPFYYLNYNKQDAQNLIIEKYNWQYYGEHHHESLFTKYAIGYWLYNKFGIDKRKVTYSAQVREGKISRDVALEIVKKPPFLDNVIPHNEFNYLINKLGITDEEYRNIWCSVNHVFRDYPNSFNTLKFVQKNFSHLMEIMLNRKPGINFVNKEF